MGVFFRESAAITIWDGLASEGEEWINAERIWIKIHDGKTSKAVCGFYMRTESKTDAEFYLRNESLTNLLTREIEYLEKEGLDVGLLGDTNSWVKSSPRFQFEHYPHRENNNGRLLARFVEENDLHCLNPLKWQGRKEERLTFQRIMGNKVHKSIIDFALCSTAFAASVVDFKVSDEDSVSVDSDHSTLVLSYNASRKQAPPPVRNVNIYRNINKWEAYSKILEERMEGKLEWFKGISIEDQGTWITNELKFAGRRTLPSLSPSKNRSLMRKSHRPSPLAVKAKKLRGKVRDAVNNNDAGVDFSALSEAWRCARHQLFKENLAKKFTERSRIRRIIDAKGREGAKLFWKCVNKSKKSSIGISALDSGKGIVTDAEEKARIIEGFFKTKFVTADVPSPLSGDLILDKNLGSPRRKLSPDQSSEVMAEISIGELNATLDKLNIAKAEGLDQITNAMLKNTGEAARRIILELLNSTVIGGVIPSEWKVGNVILTLKRIPGTDINNYRPITLISCLSKVLTSILAQRIAAAVESSELAGDLQNGFRKSRSCADNIFILNSLLELNKNQRLKSHLLFIDLQEAYDRVDRRTLFRKLEQLNFPGSLVRLLQDYYLHDCIVTEAGGSWTKRQFQQRGLRQGCPLSSILFVIYLSELGDRLNESGLGAKVSPEDIIAYLMFADDKVLAANSVEDLEELKSIIEGWCYDFKMKISQKKTQVISPESNQTWSLLDLNKGDLIELQQVKDYTYLGVKQKLTVKATSSCKEDQMVKKAQKYANNILRLRRTVPDQVDTYRAIWENIAIPTILYAVEVIPIGKELIQKLDLIQRTVARTLLGVPRSSLNQVSEVEMGFKPFLLRILTIKLKFFIKVQNGDSRCSTTQTCQRLLIESGSSEYLSNLDELLGCVKVTHKNIDNSTLSLVNDYHTDLLVQALATRKTFRIMPIPKRWWKKSSHVEEGPWSKMLSKFRCMNAGLGNRDNIYRNLAVSVAGGMVVDCPLCLSVDSNNEIHILTKCPVLDPQRNSIMVKPGQSLHHTLVEISQTYSAQSPEETTRLFIGQERSLTRLDLMRRGNALIKLMDAFFAAWSAKADRPVLPRDR